MRLVKTSTLTLHEFFGKETPPYAILSHRWGDAEVTFQDMQDDSGRKLSLSGWKKLQGCCAKAAQDKWEYVWIDSCCIDKTSSAELSEAINSMFDWYRGSQVCYAYLTDVEFNSPKTSLRNSAWFTRGWTLQELLAPRWVEFFDVNWIKLGTKFSLAAEIGEITGITHLFNYQDACVAQKMSWASKRETKRIEDQAYSLMGIFEVHMPLLYGEGASAFTRLQMEILGKTDDESIFAWNDPSFGTPSGGLLAPSPLFFRSSRSARRAYFDPSRTPYTMTNKGLRLELLLQPNPSPSEITVHPEYLAPLNCTMENSFGDRRYLVALCLVDQDGKYSRTKFLKLIDLSQEAHLISTLERKSIYVIQPSLKSNIQMHSPLMIVVRIPTTLDFEHGSETLLTWPTQNRYRAIEFDATTDYRQCVWPVDPVSQVRISALKLRDIGHKIVLLIGTSPERAWIHLDITGGREISDAITAARWPLDESDPRTYSDKTSQYTVEGHWIVATLKRTIYKGSVAYVIEIKKDKLGRK